MLKKNFKQEQGRSMVEMLGVLAVIGVLSVAGIAGYTSAMNQHKANEIVNATSVLYMMAQSQKQGQGDNMNYTSIGASPTGTSQIAYDNTTKAITITFTDDSLCPPVKNKLGDKAGECSSATTPATGYNLTINFRETTTSQTPEEAQEDLTIVDMQDGNCPFGYKPTGIDDKCAKSLADATKLCSTGCAQDTPLEYACVDSSYCL